MQGSRLRTERLNKVATSRKLCDMWALLTGGFEFWRGSSSVQAILAKFIFSMGRKSEDARTQEYWEQLNLSVEGEIEMDRAEIRPHGNVGFSDTRT